VAAGAAVLADELLAGGDVRRIGEASFQIGRAGDTEEALTPLLTRFARWSEARAAVQTATLIVVATAIAAGT